MIFIDEMKNATQAVVTMYDTKDPQIKSLVFIKYLCIGKRTLTSCVGRSDIVFHVAARR